MLRLLLKEKAADKLTIIKIKAICFQLLSTASVSSFAEALIASTSGMKWREVRC